jgi:hypothetical protein
MKFDHMRFMAASGGPLGDLVLRSLQETGGWSIENMRRPGFRMLDAAMQDTLRTLAPLPVRSEVVLDKVVVEVGLQRLTFVADIMAEGLTYNLPDPLSVPFLESNSISKVQAAQRTMSPSSRGENSIPIMTPGRVPIYLTTDMFTLDIRLLKESQRVGLPLDTSLIKQKTRAVNEALEDAAINGATTIDGQQLTVGGYTAPGMLNAPFANLQTLTNSAWTGTTPVGATVQSEILQMVIKLQNSKKFGPYNLYIPTAAGVALNYDFKVNGNDSILERIKAMDVGSSRPIRVRVADLLPTTKVGLIQMTDDVVDIVDGQRPTVIPWTSNDGFTFYNLIMAIQVPRFRADFNGNSGVCVGTLT